MYVSHILVDTSIKIGIYYSQRKGEVFLAFFKIQYNYIGNIPLVSYK